MAYNIVDTTPVSTLTKSSRHVKFTNSNTNVTAQLVKELANAVEFCLGMVAMGDYDSHDQGSVA